MRFRTLDDADVKGKRVLVRVDLNVPMHDGKVTDASRIERNAPTIIELADRGGKVILLSHYGRPKGRDPEGVARARRCRGRAHHRPPDRLCRRLHRPGRRSGGRRLMRPATFFAWRTPASTRARKRTIRRSRRRWRSSATFMSTTRSRSRTARTRPWKRSRICCRPMPGRAMQAELEALERALHAPQRPVAAIVGGAKISTKLELLGNLLNARRYADHRRRHGQHLPRRAGQGRRQIAVRKRSAANGARHPGQGEIARAARSCCRSMWWWRKHSPRTRPRASCRSTRSAPTT